MTNTMELCIHLLDNSFHSIEVEPEDTSWDICEQLCVHYGIDEKLAVLFSLNRSQDGFTVGQEIEEDEDLVSVYRRSCKIFFKIRLFTDICFDFCDPALSRLLYIQCKYNIVTETYPCKAEVLVQLVALQLYGQKHNFRKPGSLIPKLLEYVPISALETKKPSRWEADILKALKLFETQNINPISSYLEIVHKEIKCYGTSTFRVLYTNLPEVESPLILCVGRFGIMLLNEKMNRVLKVFYWEALAFWGNENSCTFLIEEKGTKHSQIEFTVTDNSEEICMLLSDYAETIAKANAFIEVPHSEQSDTTKVNTAEMERAATLIQAHVRGELQRMKFDIILDENWESYKEWCSIVIQTAYRGYRARCLLDEMITNLESELDISELGMQCNYHDQDAAAATKISAFVRGFLVRRDLDELDRDISARIIQSCFRCYRSTHRAQKQENRFQQIPTKEFSRDPYQNFELTDSTDGLSSAKFNLESVATPIKDNQFWDDQEIYEDERV